MTYTTKTGDMWDLIAYRELGSELYTEALINANRDHADTFIFKAGVVLTLPTVQSGAKISLPPWRKSS